jgi:hypothetical protein
MPEVRRFGRKNRVPSSELAFIYARRAVRLEPVMSPVPILLRRAVTTAG